MIPRHTKPTHFWWQAGSRECRLVLASIQTKSSWKWDAQFEDEQFRELRRHSSSIVRPDCCRGNQLCIHDSIIIGYNFQFACVLPVLQGQGSEETIQRAAVELVVGRYSIGPDYTAVRVDWFRKNWPRLRWIGWFPVCKLGRIDVLSKLWSD